MYGEKLMDRRQKKTRAAILNAFIKLLSIKRFEHITVAEIIDYADVGRATFYSHFETKDFLLKELCEELFCHIFDVYEQNIDHNHIFKCDATGSAFYHLITHLQKNDNNILELLSSGNNDVFLGYFKQNLLDFVKKQPELLEIKRSDRLPDSLWISHIVSTLIETISWWIDNGKTETPETLTEYFHLAI